MKIAYRLFALLIVVPATYFFIFWVPRSLIPVGEQIWIRNIVSLLFAFGMGWYVWTKSDSVPNKLMTCIFYGAIMVGAIGFSVGFWGPIIFSPGANQGPLLGLFITGPLGFILGGFLGFFYWLLFARGSEFK
jgi:hypothetical protein